MEGRKVVQKSKGRQELHRGLLLRLWPFEKIHFDSFTVFCGLFWSLLQKHASRGCRGGRQRGKVEEQEVKVSML